MARLSGGINQFTIIKALEKQGWLLKRNKGPHMVYEAPNGQVKAFSKNTKKDLDVAICRSKFKDIGYDLDEIMEEFRKPQRKIVTIPKVDERFSDENIRRLFRKHTSDKYSAKDVKREVNKTFRNNETNKVLSKNSLVPGISVFLEEHPDTRGEFDNADNLLDALVKTMGKEDKGTYRGIAIRMLNKHPWKIPADLIPKAKYKVTKKKKEEEEQEVKVKPLFNETVKSLKGVSSLMVLASEIKGHLAGTPGESRGDVLERELKDIFKEEQAEIKKRFEWC